MLMDPEKLFRRYQELQRYVGWTPDDAVVVRELAPLVEPHYPSLVDDFYDELQRHPEAVKVITGGAAQIQRLKGTLISWLRELFSGRYDADYVTRRWMIGYRHVEIGLDQVYTNAALSRLRRGMLQVLERHWAGPTDQLLRGREVLNMLVDLDLALIEDAYQAEYTFRRQSAERLALIGQVAGGIAHELRNPLNVIKTSVYYLLNARRASPEKTAQHLQRIERQVYMADGVIVALTKFAKMELPDRQPFSLHEVLSDLLSSTDCPPNVELQLDCSADLPQALADANQIRIVIANLIRNAIDAMPQGGRLRIAAQRVDRYLDLSVSDSGPGIDPQALQRIMEPFYSTKARGVGLGLPMAKAIVEKNEGWLTVQSWPGRGSRFVVRLRSAPADT